MSSPFSESTLTDRLPVVPEVSLTSLSDATLSSYGVQLRGVDRVFHDYSDG